jgi:hypothetical protein
VLALLGQTFPEPEPGLIYSDPVKDRIGPGKVYPFEDAVVRVGLSDLGLKEPTGEIEEDRLPGAEVSYEPITQ